ncbi:MAG TPA: hypothetical protein VEI83_10750 [Acidimicrobiales bacterium]|nr:hypothetical protein [Acidimicrobiales bacterium]
MAEIVREADTVVRHRDVAPTQCAHLKRCPYCERYVHGRGATDQLARVALRNAMVRHVEDIH